VVPYIHQQLLTPAMWVPATELQVGQSFRGNQDPREPRYEHPGMTDNIYDNTWPYEQVSPPYGAWPVSEMQGFGGLIASAPAMLEFLQRYHASPFRADFGEPIIGTLTSGGGHNGSLPGTNTSMFQRADGINVFIAFNRRDNDDPHFGADFYSTQLAPLLDAVTTWPTATSDGFWVNTPGTGTSGGVGGYDLPFVSVSAALGYVQDGSKLRLKPGASAWTGVLNTRVLLDAPLGSAVLGQ
jgi:hypothetical protein